MALEKVCRSCQSGTQNSALNSIPHEFIDRAKKYLDPKVIEDFRTFMSQAYHYGRREYHNWCFVNLSKMPFTPPTSEKISHFAPVFVSLISGALRAKNEQDANHFISVIKGINSLKTAVLKAMCENPQNPDLESPRYLLKHGNFSPTLKDKILIQLALKGAHVYFPLFEEGTNPLFKLATRVNTIDKAAI